MNQTSVELGIPNVWGVLFTQNLDVIEVFPKNFDAVDIRALAEINEVLDEWVKVREISEIIDADSRLYAGKIGNMILYVTGDLNSDFSGIWEVVRDVKSRYGKQAV
ncbi:MAG: hypothetical protein V1836_00590 [Candidatus Aenigmatarchaeota archaeon]